MRGGGRAVNTQDLSASLRQAKPGTSHRDAPLTDRALQELAAFESELPRVAQAPLPKRRLGRNSLLAAAAVITLLIVVGSVNLHAQSAQAVSVLRDAATATIRFSDPTPRPGQYLESSTRAQWMREDAGSGTSGALGAVQMIDVYAPQDRGADWVLVRDWGGAPSAGTHETRRAKDGSFYGSPWLSVDPADIPRGTGRQVLDYFDEHYSGGSSSRDEDNFVRICDLLASGLVPAPVRARLYDALSLIPGVTSTAGVANLDGRTGIAIGRTEPLRGGLRQEIIIDPETGLVLGQRQLHTVALLGFGVNEVVGLTAVSTRVADTAPSVAP
ncbi:hypothetical protein [Microbacterium luticocti]|uniref:hypothetical protein n=1 Tax=Microbacterium luticocti TaxID=451764 RepID=UPI000490A682|nr:hypothetical protein [Microbacterium luticocti]